MRSSTIAIVNIVSTLLALSLILVAQERKGVNSEPEVLAELTAREQFKKDERDSVLANFHVIVREGTDALEVIFVPNLPPRKTRYYQLGGGNIYGREVHYFVEKNTYRIIRRHFAR
jgi:hypothetical protein